MDPAVLQLQLHKLLFNFLYYKQPFWWVVSVPMQVSLTPFIFHYVQRF
jgi:hypothetical protein